MDMRHKKTLREKKEAVTGFVFISPWIIGMVVFFGGPLLFSLCASFTNYNMTSQMDFIGIENFIRMFKKDPIFWKSLKNTLIYVAMSVPFSCIFALITSSLLNRKLPGANLFRMLFYLPTVLTGVAVYQLWLQILSPKTGLINTILSWVGINGPAWMSDPAWTKPALAMMRVWAMGTSMLLYLSAMNSVPHDLYEAADIDGASSLKKFFRITLPQISPIIFFDIITCTAGAFQVFQEAYVMSRNGTGEPAGSLMFYNLHLFKEAFEKFNMGYASAMAWFLFIIVMGITLINTLVSKYWVHTEGGENT